MTGAARACLAIALVTVLLFAARSDAGGQPATQPAAGRLAGLRLDDALARLQQQGLRLIYSSQIVRSDMVVRREPAGPTARAILDQLLQPHGLLAREGPGGTILVVRNPRAPRPVLPAAAPATGPPPRAVPTPDSSEAIRFSVTVDVADGDVTPAATGGTPFTVQALEIAALAGGFENLFRAVQALPGVVGTEELGSRIAVRGGGPDQNLTVMDGVEIHNPFRLMMPADDAGAISLASTFNTETIKRVDLYPAAFDVRYGDRLSSLLVVEQRDGAEAVPIEGTAFVGLTDANLVIEGRLPGDTRGSWLVSARRGFVDLVPERVVGTTLPTFYDVQSRGLWRERPGRQVTVMASASRERSQGGRTTTRDAGQSTRTRGASAAVIFAATVGAHTSTRTMVALSRVDDALDAFERSLDNNRGANSPESIAGGGALAFRLARDAEIDDAMVREDVGVAIGSRHMLDAGAETHRLRTRWRWQIDGDRSLLQANGSSLRLGQGLPAALDSTVESMRSGAWLQDRWQVTSGLTVQPGIRIDHSTYTQATSWSPRLSGTFVTGPRWRFDAAARLHTQTPGYEKTLQADYFLDLTRRPARLRPERAVHVVGGVERSLPGGSSVRVDAFLKRFSGLVVGRLESPAEQSARLATYDVPSSLWAAVDSEPHITVEPTNGGQGIARGLEVLASRAASARSPVSGWASYAYGRARRTAYGVTVPFDYDRRHAVSLVTNVRLGRRADFALSGRWASGLPRTPVRGVRLALAADASDSDADGNRSEIVPLRDGAGRPLYQPRLGDLANINSGRRPGFSRIDARITFRPAWGGERWTLHADLLNVLNARNPGFVDSMLVYDPTGDRPGIVEVPGDRGVPFFPSFGVRVRF